VQVETLNARQSRSVRCLEWLIGLHGLALVVVFPLGPQQVRLWHPGVLGIALLVAVYPLAVVIGGALARRQPVLPTSVRVLAVLAGLGFLPAVFSVDHLTFLAARVVGGLIAGVSLVALQRELPAAAIPAANRLATRLTAFGLPVCVVAATVTDWRAPFWLLLAGAGWLAWFAPSRVEPATQRPFISRTEAAPNAMIATGALAFVSGSYLTVLSGFLVLNAGQSEYHITAALLVGAGLGLVVPSGVRALRRRLSPRHTLTAILIGSGLSLTALLALRTPLPAGLAVGLIGCFLAVNAARHVALAEMVFPRLSSEHLPAHQIHFHLAHHGGSALGALAAGWLAHSVPGGGLTGMGSLLICGLAATALAWSAAASTTAQVVAAAANPTAGAHEAPPALTARGSS
jgi:hypothetical protein